MEKYMITYGGSIPPVVECINPKKDKWRVRWNITEGVPEYNHSINNDEFNNRIEYQYYESEFNHKPSIDEIKELILGQMNDDIDNKILSGFTWNNMSVWLSTENQFNYKAAYDLAIQTGGDTLPVTFKFGTSDSPEYHTFNDIPDLTDFYTKSVAYVQSVLNEGWTNKDSFDFSKYNI